MWSLCCSLVLIAWYKAKALYCANCLTLYWAELPRTLIFINKKILKVKSLNYIIFAFKGLTLVNNKGIINCWNWTGRRLCVTRLNSLAWSNGFDKIMNLFMISYSTSILIRRCWPKNTYTYLFKSTSSSHILVVLSVLLESPGLNVSAKVMFSV